MNRPMRIAAACLIGALVPLLGWQPWRTRDGTGGREPMPMRTPAQAQTVPLDDLGEPPADWARLRIGTRRLRDRTFGLRWLDSGEAIASVGWAFHRWSADGGEELSYWADPRFGAVNCVSPDGRWLASTARAARDPASPAGPGESDIVIYDVVSRRVVARLRGHAMPASALTFSDDGRRLASGAVDGTVRLWDVAAGTQIAQARWREGLAPGSRTEACAFVRFSRNGRRLASGGIDPTPRREPHAAGILYGVKVWECPDLALKGTLVAEAAAAYAGAFADAVFSADDTELLAAGLNGGLWSWRVDTGQRARPLRPTPHGLLTIDASRDGRWVAAGDTDGAICLWSTDGDAPPRLLKSHPQRVAHLAFSPGGDRLVAASGQALTIWDVAEGHPLGRDEAVHDDAILALAASPASDLLATAGVGGTIRLWDAATGRLRRVLAGHEGFVVSLAFAPDGRSLASGGTDGLAKTWDLATGQPRRTFSEHADAVIPVLFAPDGRRLVTGGKDSSVRVWDAATGAELWRLGTPGGPAGLSPDSSTLAVVGHLDPATRRVDPSIRRLDVGTGRDLGLYRGGRDFPLALPSVARDGSAWGEGTHGPIVQLWREGPAGPELFDPRLAPSAISPGSQYFSVAAFSPDGRYLALATNATITLLDRPSGAILRQWVGHRDGITGLLFDAAGRELISASQDTTIVIWDLCRVLAPKP